MNEQPLLADELAHLLERALRAPSGDNTQPWRFVVRPSQVEVWFDAPRARALLDVSQLASRLALGALLESLALAGRPRGVRVEWSLDPDQARPTLWALVQLSRTAPVAEVLADFLDQRHTNRSQFEMTPLCAEDQAALLAEAVPGSRLRLVTDRAAIEPLADQVATADGIRMRNRQAHRDLYHWLRWTKDRAEATRDGLDVRTLGVSRVQRLALRATEPWPMARLADLFGVTRLAEWYARDQVLRGGAMGLFTVAQATPALATAAGRGFQRVWLRATQRGLALCPHAALPMLLLRAELLGGDQLDPGAVATLCAMGPAFRALFGAEANEQPLFLFRVGRAPAFPVRSLRRDVQGLIS